MYVDDYNDTMAPLGQSTNAWNFKLASLGYITSDGQHQFIKHNSLSRPLTTHWPTLMCPSEQEFEYTAGWTWTAYTHFYSRSSYGMNQNVMRAPDPNNWFGSDRGFTQIRVRTTTPDTASILIDNGMTVTNGNQFMCFEDEIDNYNNYATALYNGQLYNYHAFRHTGGRTNVLFLDGHVEPRQPYWKSGVYIYRSLWEVNAGR
jgi:prepilin-type processing-associated H-X9-DG protein